MISSTPVGKSNVVAKPPGFLLVPWLPRKSKNLTDGGNSRSKKFIGKRLFAPTCSKYSHTNEAESNKNATDAAEHRAAETSGSESHANDDENDTTALSNISQDQTNQNNASGLNVGAKFADLTVIKIKEENVLLRSALQKLSNRLGDEHLSDSSLESDDLEDGPPITVTTNYQMDNILTPKYYITWTSKSNYPQLSLKHYKKRTLPIRYLVVIMINAFCILY